MGIIGTSHLLLDANIQQQIYHKYNEQQQTMITSEGFIKVLVTRELSKGVIMYSNTLSKGMIDRIRITAGCVTRPANHV